MDIRVAPTCHNILPERVGIGQNISTQKLVQTRQVHRLEIESTLSLVHPLLGLFQPK